MERLKFSFAPSFWIFALLSVCLGKGVFCLTYFVAVVLHELAHYFVAKRLFYRSSELKLSAFGAVLYGEFDDAFNSDKVKIALAGPLVNVALALLCLAVWWIFPPLYALTENFFDANVTMAVVNLLPCYPLDGGRIVSGVLEKRFSAQKSLKTVKIFTAVTSLVLFAVFVLGLFYKTFVIGALIFAVCLLSALVGKSGGESYKRVGFAWQNKGRLLSGMEKKTLIFGQNATMSQVALAMRGNFVYDVEVVDERFNTVGYLSVKNVDDLILHYDPGGSLKNALKFVSQRF